MDYPTEVVDQISSISRSMNEVRRKISVTRNLENDVHFLSERYGPIKSFDEGFRTLREIFYLELTMLSEDLDKQCTLLSEG